MLNRFIEQLIVELRWDKPIEKREDGTFLLRFEGNVSVVLKQYENGTLCFFSEVAPLSKENESASLQKLMMANLLGKETGKAILGLNAERTTIVLTTFLPKALSYKQFFEYLEDFTNYSDVWKNEMRHFNEKGA